MGKGGGRVRASRSSAVAGVEQGRPPCRRTPELGGRVGRLAREPTADPCGRGAPARPWEPARGESHGRNGVECSRTGRLLRSARRWVAGTAHAGTGAFEDPVGDSTSVDISQVRVVHRNAVKVSVRSAVPLAAGQVYSFWIDTGRGPRPTFHVSVPRQLRLRRLARGRAVLRSATDARGRCPGMRAHADMFDEAPVSLRSRGAASATRRGPRGGEVRGRDHRLGGLGAGATDVHARGWRGSAGSQAFAELVRPCMGRQVRRSPVSRGSLEDRITQRSLGVPSARARTGSRS